MSGHGRGNRRTAQYTRNTGEHKLQAFWHLDARSRPKPVISRLVPLVTITLHHGHHHLLARLRLPACPGDPAAVWPGGLPCAPAVAGTRPGTATGLAISCAPPPGERSAWVPLSPPAPPPACRLVQSTAHARCPPPPRLQLHARTPPAAARSSGDATPAAAAAATAAVSAHASTGRHAFLHDFCMCIPYGALVAAGGLVGKLVGWGQPATVMLVVGGLQLALSYLSLSVWRKARSAAPYTLAEAGKRGLGSWQGEGGELYAMQG